MFLKSFIDTTARRLFAVALIWCGSLAGQESLSTIRGSITDPSGSVVPGAEISVQEVDTNIRVRTLTSDSEGNFEMPGLKPGSYRLTATLAGCVCGSIFSA